MAKSTNETKKNTYVELEMADGSIIKMTLAYRWLLALSSFDKAAYKAYNTVLVTEPKNREEIDNVRIAYAAYLCALLQEGEEATAMTFNDFIDAITPDRPALQQALKSLMNPKATGSTEQHLQ